MTSTIGRREAILINARRLFAERGVTATSVRDIAEAVGMLSGSLYHHYASKNAMIDAILADYLQDLVAGYRGVAEREPGPIERLDDLVQFAFSIARELPEPALIYQRDGEMLAGQERFAYVAKATAEVRDIWLRTIEAGQSVGSIRADVDPDVTSRLIRGSIWSAANWFVPSPDYPTSRFLKDAIEVFVSGYQDRGGPPR